MVQTYTFSTVFALGLKHVDIRNLIEMSQKLR